MTQLLFNFNDHSQHFVYSPSRSTTSDKIGSVDPPNSPTSRITSNLISDKAQDEMFDSKKHKRSLKLTANGDHPADLEDNTLSVDSPPMNFIEPIRLPSIAKTPSSSSQQIDTVPLFREIPVSRFDGHIRDKSLPYADFYSSWRYVMPSGQHLTYRLTLRFYKDLSAEMILHNIEGAQYHLDYIDGLYGQTTRLDLFIGATVKLFGRNIVIKAASNRVCDEIEVAAKFLLRKQTWLLSKMRSLGIHPKIRQRMELTKSFCELNAGIDKNKRRAGQINLRGIVKENMILCEQLTSLGYAHLIANINHRINDEEIENSIFWTN